MRIQPSLRGLALVSLTTLLFVVLAVTGISTAETNTVSSQAAVPTIEKSIRGRNEFTSDNEAVPAASPPVCPQKVGSQCVLTSDAVLEHTLVLLSDTTLDCQGHKLRPPRLGSPIALVPQVGIFLNHVKNVVIKGCVIDGFDFGIFAINSKLENPLDVDKPFVVTGNTIKSRYTSVSLMSVDNAEISNNDISYTTATGRALYVGRNSDLNKIFDNRFVADLVLGANAIAFRVPGPQSAANPRVTVTTQGAGAVVVIAEVEGAEPTLLNAVIEKQLFQLTTTNQQTTSLTEVNREFSEGNTVSGNRVRFSPLPVGSPAPVDGIAVAVAQGTTIRNNRVEAGAQDGIRAGIRVGMQNGFDKVFPGKCNLKPERFCLENVGCNIPGFDLSAGGIGDTCTSRDVRTVSWISRDTVIDGNEVTGPLTNGIITSGHRTTIKGNKINGGGAPKTRVGVGIGLVGKHAIETTTVLQNSVFNVAVALSLIKSLQGLEAFSFGSKISLNDFTAYETAVLASKVPPPTPVPFNPAAFYNLSSELSVAGQGNFWGISSCPAFDPAKVVRGEETSVNHLVPDIHLITDRHPFKVSVAKTPIPSLPNPCPSGP